MSSSGTHSHACYQHRYDSEQICFKVIGSFKFKEKLKQEVHYESSPNLGGQSP